MQKPLSFSAPFGKSIIACLLHTSAHYFLCSYDAHPMSILTSAFAYLGSYYSEANPSLQGTQYLKLECLPANLDFYKGQTLFTKGDKASLANMDKQIYRLIGKATTLAASVSLVCCPILSLTILYQNGLPGPTRSRLCCSSDWSFIHWIVSNSKSIRFLRSLISPDSCSKWIILEKRITHQIQFLRRPWMSYFCYTPIMN